MDFYEIQELANEVANNAVGTSVPRKAKEVGLDSRVGTLYIGEDYVAVKKGNVGSLDYYGGFQYVDKESRMEIGNFVFFSAEADRVQKVIEASQKLEIA